MADFLFFFPKNKRAASYDLQCYAVDLKRAKPITSTAIVILALSVCYGNIWGSKKLKKKLTPP